MTGSRRSGLEPTVALVVALAAGWTFARVARAAEPTSDEPRAPGPLDADPWFGADKRLHFEAASALALLGYAWASFQTENRPIRATAALTLAVGAGVGKELLDLTGHGDASWRDLTWDLVGAATGAVVAGTIDWIAHAFSARASPRPADR